MNTKTKRRAIVATGIIVIVLIIVLAVVGGASAARAVTVEQAASGDMGDAKIQVSGNVVPDSFSVDEKGVLTFNIYDEDSGDMSVQLPVSYDGGVSATFGNDVTAICTGRIGDDGVLYCTELVTKCPSKYENRTDALSVSRLLDYGEDVLNKTVKVTGTVKDGTLSAVGEGDRFVLLDADDQDAELRISYQGALSDEVTDGASVVVTGDLISSDTFNATDVALAQ